MRTVLIAGTTLGSMLVINLFAARLLHMKLIDLFFLIGVIFIAFTRTMSFTSREKSELTFNDDYRYQETTGFNVDRDKRTFLPSVPFYIALMYALISLVHPFVRLLARFL